MELMLIGGITVVVFALLLTALAFREHRNKKRPPIHTCRHNQPCTCHHSRSIIEKQTRCEDRPAPQDLKKQDERNV